MIDMADRFVPVDDAQLGRHVGLHRAMKEPLHQLAFILARQFVGGPDRMLQRQHLRRSQRNQAKERGKGNPSGAKPGRDLSLCVVTPGCGEHHNMQH